MNDRARALENVDSDGPVPLDSAPVESAKKRSDRVGARIRALRNARVPILSQRELADAVGVTKMAISRIETAETSIDAELLIRIADYFGRNPADFLAPDGEFKI